MDHNLMNPDRCGCPGCRVADLADVAVLAIMELVRIEEELTDEETNGDLVGAAKAIMGMRYHLLYKLAKEEGVTA